GGALRYPVSFDTSRSRGWSVVAVDMVALMREGTGGGGGGREYGVLRAVRLGSNMVVRGVYASDCVYSPHTLPKDMAFRPPSGGMDWETAYNWLWLPEVPDENAAPPRNGARATTRPAWPPGADSPTSSVAAANVADARERRRMEKRHFFAEPGTLGKLLAQQDSEEDAAAVAKAREPAAAAATTPGRGRSTTPGIRGRAAGKGRRELSLGGGGGGGGASVGATFPRTPRRGGGAVACIAALSPTAWGRRGRSTPPQPRGSPRAPYPGGGGGGGAHFSRWPLSIASPARMRPASAAASASFSRAAGVAAPSPSPRYRYRRSVSRTRDRTTAAAPSPTVATGARGKPPLSPRRGGRGVTKGGRVRAFFGGVGDGDDGGGGGPGGGGGGGGGADDGFNERGLENGSDWNWTREELEAWPGREPAPATPVVAVLKDIGERNGAGGEEEEEEEEGRRVAGGRSRRGGVSGNGGMDPPVVTRVLPPGLEASRPEPPEFDPDPALRLERALCYTGGDLPGTTTVVFVGPGAEYMAFPCNNVVVLMETPVMPEAVFPEGGGFGFGVVKEDGLGGGGWEGSGAEGLPPAPPAPPLPPPSPPPQIFLRGHTDTVTRLSLSHAGHLLASAQGDPLGAAG
ncbi:unnamed protein product, partial [Hapterophycus canaliculatus]